MIGATPSQEAARQLDAMRAIGINTITVYVQRSDEVAEVDTSAPADAAATHGPPATAVAEAEGEVDLDTVAPQPAIAPPPEVPAGIPVEHEETHEEA